MNRETSGEPTGVPSAGSVLSYEEAKALARDADPSVRADLARREDIKGEILYYLTGDPSAEVRRVLAQNGALPAQADRVLADDPEESVRLGVAEKIARLVPQLEPDERDRVSRATVETLQILARDQATRVRRILSETLKDVPNVPSDVINRLARDVEIMVAAPVLACSPVLSDDDLLEIIAKGPLSDRLVAISRRHQVSFDVCDAIVASGDREATAELLANKSAQIREETIDRLVELAENVHPWHRPLVERPHLPKRAAVRLASFVAESLVAVLAARSDLGSDTISDIRETVQRRIREGTFDPEAMAEAAADNPHLVDAEELMGDSPGRRPQTVLDIVIQMRTRGELNEDAVSTALARGDVDLVTAAVAVLGGLDVSVVELAMESGSASDIVAVCWRADLSAALAERIQEEAGDIDGGDVITASGSGGYVMDSDELGKRLSALQQRAYSDSLQNE